MWFGTTDGLFRFDSRVFKKYVYDSENSRSITTSYIQDIICDSHDDLWIAAPNGLTRYNKTSDTFTSFRHDPENANSLSSDRIYTILEDSQGGFWVGTGKGLNYLTIEGADVQVTRYRLTDNQSDSVRVRSLAEGPDGTLWIGTWSGLVRMRKDGTFRTTFDYAEKGKYPSKNIFNTIYAGENNTIWLAPRSGGLFRFDVLTQTLRMVPDFKTADNAFPEVTRIVPDKQNGFWIATTSGLAHLDTLHRHCHWYTNKHMNPNSLSDNALLGLCMDRQGGVWLGTYNAGVDYFYPGSVDAFVSPVFWDSAATQPFDAAWVGRHKRRGLWAVSEDRRKIVFMDPGTKKQAVFSISLTSPNTYNSFYVDSSGVVWAGGEAILSGYDLNKGEMKEYPLRVTGNSLKGRIYSIYEDRTGRLWVGGAFGLLLFDRRRGLFQEVYKSDGTSLSAVSLRVTAIFEDSGKNLWVGGAAEVYVSRPGAKGFERIQVDQSADPSRLATISAIREDISDRLWFGTGSAGLQVYDPVLNRVSGYHHGEKIPVDEAFDILTDRSGFIWINDQRGGLTRYHPDTRNTQQYDYMDGLPSNQVKASAGFQDVDGTLYFGTTKGVVGFNPIAIRINSHPAPLLFSSLKLFNEPVNVGDETGILNQSLPASTGIELRHDQNIFTLEFAALNYIRPDKNRYAFRLEGFEKQWNYSSNPSATYMNLSPGSYTFLIKAANNDGYWSENPARLAVAILPPWWQTWYAYLAYLLMTIALVYAITRFFWIRSSFRKESELYQAKLDFFTNVSHEIRTHLALIGGPLQKVFQSPSIDADNRNLLGYAKRNSDNLMALVNELLTFRKMESGDVTLRVSEENLVDNIKMVHAAFEHAFREKHIETQLEFPGNKISLWYDASQMQKVFYNLLGNACKFTPEGGRVRVLVAEDDRRVRVTIADNGRGISPGHLEKIFDNFFQEYNSDMPNRGYGIGLALARSIVERHGGLLTVTSQADGETCFSVQILKGNDHFNASQLSESPLLIGMTDYPETRENRLLAGARRRAQKYTLLLIEDNEELRAFGREALQSTYNILEAGNGRTGIEMAREHLPQLIVSDIMMPEMNGLDLCIALKSDVRTSHIPLILLTAKGATDHMIQGLKAGADAYLVKPFDIRVLELKIKNLIHTRHVLQHKNNRFVTVEPDGTVLNELDKRFLVKLEALVEQHISDPDFDVSGLAEQIGMSVSVLYRKLRAITGMTVNDFVKSVKMKQAAQLLALKTYHVNEVASMVGYMSRKHFSREFRKMYGKAPSKFEEEEG